MIWGNGKRTKVGTQDSRGDGGGARNFFVPEPGAQSFHCRGAWSFLPAELGALEVLLRCLQSKVIYSLLLCLPTVS